MHQRVYDDEDECLDLLEFRFVMWFRPDISEDVLKCLKKRFPLYLIKKGPKKKPA